MKSIDFLDGKASYQELYVQVYLCISGEVYKIIQLPVTDT